MLLGSFWIQFGPLWTLLGSILLLAHRHDLAVLSVTHSLFPNYIWSSSVAPDLVWYTRQWYMQVGLSS